MSNIIEPKRIEAAFSNLAMQRVYVGNAVEAVNTAQIALQDKKTQVFAEGKIDGKNETERKAQYDVLCAQESIALGKREADLRKAQMNFDLAKMEVECCKTLVYYFAGSGTTIVNTTLSKDDIPF